MRPLFRPALATDDTSGYVLAYEKDPDNRVAVRLRRSGRPLSGKAAHAFDAPRTLARRTEGTADITSVHDGTVELTGHHRARRDTDRELRATLKDFTTWYATSDRRPDRVLESWGARDDIGDRRLLELAIARPFVTESQQCCGGVGS
ncbi:hypothetical protein ACFZDJ_21570 [Streptomyces sp. NPDC007896]|uniref:hypothetical protein n=1 Tax=Streptomyces sp. NPDC007896 TaxID=3364784 RepID=UPI0036E5C0BD